jgi:hypothetical protein
MTGTPDLEEASMIFGQAVNTATSRLKQAVHAFALILSEPPARDAEARALPEDDTVFQEDAARPRVRSANPYDDVPM